MSKQNTNLHLVLRTQWYDKIESGEKTKEYREIKKYYNHLLFCRNYETVSFSRAYTKTKMKFKLASIKKINTENDLGLKECYEISLGERLL